MKRKLTTETDREMTISYIKRLDLKKLFIVEVLQKLTKRTISQNSLYWLWLTAIEFETGNDRNNLHEYFKEKYLIPEDVIVFGEKRESRSTKNLNTTQFKYYLDHIQVFASTELAIKLPDPKDRYWNEFYEYYVDKI